MLYLTGIRITGYSGLVPPHEVTLKASWAAATIPVRAGDGARKVGRKPWRCRVWRRTLAGMIPEGALRSDDGYYWWDEPGQCWRPVEDSDSQLDGGALPGGVPEQQPCDCGPCPECAEDRQASSMCVHQLSHGGEHECAYGDTGVVRVVGDVRSRSVCG